MTAEQLKARMKTVAVQIAAAPEIVRFIHADMNAPTGKSLFPEENHFFYQQIGFGSVDHQDRRRIADFRIFSVCQNLLQVPQRLYAADQLYPERFRESVQLLELFHAVRSAHIPEKRLPRKKVSVLRIEHRHAVTHQCQLDQRSFHPVKTENLISGTVEHRSERLKRRRLLRFHAGEHMRNTTQKTGNRACFNTPFPVSLCNFPSVPSPPAEQQFGLSVLFRKPLSVIQRHKMQR